VKIAQEHVAIALYLCVCWVTCSSQWEGDGWGEREREREREDSRYSSSKYGNRLSNCNRSAALQTRAAQQQRTAETTTQGQSQKQTEGMNARQGQSLCHNSERTRVHHILMVLKYAFGYITHFQVLYEYLQTEQFWWPQTDGFLLSHIHNQRLCGPWYPLQCRKSHELHGGAEEPVDKNNVL